MAKITELNIYPIKSCRGIALQSATIAETGLQHDRQWVVVDAQNRFLTQRKLPRMALIETALTATELIVTTAGRPPLRVSLDGGDRQVTVQVWDDACNGFDAGDEAAQWFSEYLGQPARLARFDPAFQRLSNRKYAGNIDARNAYSDGYPILLISQASLNDLNERLATPLPMNRFRPNMVIDGIDAFDEDHIVQFSRPGLSLRPVKPCTRCEITTTDQNTGIVSEEPLRTLFTYRHNDVLNGVTFGQNIVVAEGIGQQLRVGDELTPEWNF